MAAFNNTAIGAGSTRQKYEKRLLDFLKKEFEVIVAFFSFFPFDHISMQFLHAQIFLYFVDGNYIVYELSVILCSYRV